MADDDEPTPIDLDVHFDAELSERVARFSTGGPVRGPGQAAAAAAPASGRRPRRASEVGTDIDVGARHNWIPRGPRNVGGRVRCVAVDPNNPLVLYAGPASGGVHKSVDGGQSWVALWHDERSLSMAAISVCPAVRAPNGDSQVVWAVTGETSTPGGGMLPGNGVLRSEDGGSQWTVTTSIATSEPDNTIEMHDLSFHALAAHPTQAAVCWAVGPTGAFHTRDGGATWAWHVGSYSDVAFAGTGANRRLFFVQNGAIGDRGVVIRLDDPDPDPGTGTPRTDQQIRDVIPNNSPPVPAVRSTTAAGTGTPADGKFAISGDVAYVRFANSDGGHFGVFRARQAVTGAANALTWTAMATHADFADERQGEYNLAIAVSPTDPNHVATGMVDLHLALNANVNDASAVRWIRAQAWQLFLFDRAHHADHHQLVFAPATAAADARMLLWDANDGGISRSDDWSVTVPGQDKPGYASTTTLPLPDGAPTWRKMSHGISAAQMYDLTQSPLLPTFYGCGFQDNGVWMTTGGPSWTPILAADGGFVAFDPDDPYRFVVTWQEGIAGGVFPGRVRTTRPRRGFSVQEELWPRVIHDGFDPVDTGMLAGETAFDPNTPGVLLHARTNRLYGTRPRTGDHWHVQPIGIALDLIFVPAAHPETATLEVVAGPAAHVLGLYPVLTRAGFEDVPRRGRQRRPARLQSANPGPYRLDPQSTLVLRLNGAEHTVRFTPGADLPDPANATPAQVAARITDESKGLKALPVLWPESHVVQVRTRDVGPTSRITVGGADLDFVGIAPRTYSGGAGLPAVVTIPVGPWWGVTIDLTIGGVTHSIVFPQAPPQPAGSFIAPNPTTPQVAGIVRSAMGNAPVIVTTSPVVVGLLFSATDPSRAVRLTGTAVERLGLLAKLPQPRIAALPPGAGFDLEPPSVAPGDPPSPDRTLVISDGTASAPELRFTTATLGLPGNTSRRSMTAFELRPIFAANIPAAVRVRVDLVVMTPTPGNVTEVHFPPTHRGHVWVGDKAGRLYHSSDGTSAWQEVTGPFTDCDVIEAIAVHPSDPQTVYVASYEDGNREEPPAFLHRSPDGGRTWTAVATGIEDAEHKPVGINALEIDPDDPRVLWAATDVGVFRTTDGAATWQPFNHGLPNAKVRDMVFVPSTRTLRAGAWGRGTWERHVGDRPPRDVSLYLRANEADDGTVRPAGTALDALAPAPSQLSSAQSPDIKVARTVPDLGDFLDGVEFDEDVHHGDVVPGAAEVLVQVHNGGSFPTAQPVRVAVLWAFADAGPPELPAQLWTALRGPDLLAAGSAQGSWKVVFHKPLPSGPAGAGYDTVPPGDPRVIRGNVTWPSDVVEHRAVGLVAVVTCADDQIRDDLPVDVARLLDRERRVAYRECSVLHGDDDGRIVLRRTGPAIETRALPGVGRANLTAAGNPLGLPGGVLAPDVALTGAAPFDLTPPGPLPFGVRFEADQDVVVTFDATDPNLPTLSRVTGAEAVTVIDRALQAADVQMVTFAPGGGDTVAITAQAPSVFRLLTPESTAAGVLGLSTTAGRLFVVSAGDHKAPWNLTPPAGGPPRALHVRLTTRVDLSFPQPTRGLANRAAVNGADLRAFLNRAFDLARLPLRAEPRRLGLAVRRSATEAAGTREHIGGPSLADLVVSTEAIAEADWPARFAAFAAADVDQLAAGATNHLYVRVGNIGNVRVSAARVRVLRLDPDASPVTAAEVATRTDIALDAGATAIVELTWDAPAIPAGSRVELLVVADLPAAGPDPRRPVVVPTDLADMDALDAYCATHPGVAWRQVVVA